MEPSGRQASTQTPPSHVPLQQSGPVLQKLPFGLHIPHCRPHSVSARSTQRKSHWPWQQNGSCWQTAFTHALQFGSSGGPCSHGPCAHIAGPVQIPLALQLPLQHSGLALHGVPFGLHMPHPQNCWEIGRAHV